MHNTRPSLALQRVLLFCYVVLFCEVAFAQNGRGAYISTTAKTSAWLLAQYPTKEEYLVSPNGRYWLIMGMDGRLGLYEGTSSQDRAKLLWSENGAPGLGNYFLNMQNDGNLAVWSGIPMTSSAKANGWTSGTPGPTDNYFLIVQDDANVVVYRGTGPKDNQGALWSRLTGRISRAPTPDDRIIIGRGTLPDCSRVEWRQVYNATLKTARQDAVAYVYLNKSAIEAAKGAIQSCAAQSVVAGIIAGLFTGAGSLSAAKVAFSSCLVSNNVEKSVADSIGITVESTCDW